MAETVAEVLRGLAQMDLAKLAHSDPDDPFAAAYPNFQRFLPAGMMTYRDDAVLLRRSTATAPTARLLGAMPGALSAWDENDIPAVFRALNPGNDASDRGFPTFTYSRSGNKRYMNVVRIKPGFKIQVFPDALVHDDPTAVVAMFAAAHFFARSKGFKAGFPSFNRIPRPGTTELGNEVVVFPGYSSGVVVSSDAPDDTPPSWTFESVPVISEGGSLGGFALATTADNQPLFFNIFEGKLSQYQHTPPHSILVAVDPDKYGHAHAPGPIQSEVSAVSDDGFVHVLYAERALFHARRDQGPSDYFTIFWEPGPYGVFPEGRVGDYNHMTLDPSTRDVHLFALKTGDPPGDPLDGELLHLSFLSSNGIERSELLVDGDGSGGHIRAPVGRGIATAWEPSLGPSTPPKLHAFYVLTTPDGNRLRHARLGPSGWGTETLDGSGSSEPPANPGTGPTRASVGDTPTAVSFDGSLWCIYEDQTYGNLRVARGTREGISDGPIRWTFHVLDGSGRRGQTKNTVQSAVAVVWGPTLSVFYIDEDRRVIRHAYRQTGATGWTYEVVDGDLRSG
jgi:hypothetical protein